MVRPDVHEQWRRDEASAFEGWDFGRISARSHQEEPPWSYRERAARLVRGARDLLDIDTGGGEFLRSLAPLPARSNALESYPPNVAVARDNLAPLGVAVREVAVGAAWPFDDQTFDLILNRQGHLNTREIARCLARGGVFLTQQVGGDNLLDLATLFGDTAPRADNALSAATADLQAGGLTIIQARHWTGRQTFSDVGALIYFLKAIPWVVRGFSMDTHIAGLASLQARVESGEPLTFTIERFLIEAKKIA